MHRLFTLSTQKFFKTILMSYKKSEAYLIFTDSFNILFVQFWERARTLKYENILYCPTLEITQMQMTSCLYFIINFWKYYGKQYLMC